MKIPGLQLESSPEELPWRSTRDEGIHWIDLRRAGDLEPESADGNDLSMTVLIKMDPGRGYPRHRHLGAEDVLVLAGGYADDDGRVFRAGEFVRYPAGSEHTPVALGSAEESIGPNNPACVLFAVAHGGTELADNRQIRAETNRQRERTHSPSEGRP